MTLYQVHGSHRWSLTTNQCKGCGVAILDPEAARPCPTPYKPGPRRAKEHREP